MENDHSEPLQQQWLNDSFMEQRDKKQEQRKVLLQHVAFARDLLVKVLDSDPQV